VTHPPQRREAFALALRFNLPPTAHPGALARASAAPVASAPALRHTQGKVYGAAGTGHTGHHRRDGQLPSALQGFQPAPPTSQ